VEKPIHRPTILANQSSRTGERKTLPLINTDGRGPSAAMSRLPQAGGKKSMHNS
jgi:hypothetical protein